MDSSIYLISTAEGAAPSLLVSNFIQPSWSPDGRTLAVVATTMPRIGGFPPDQALYLTDTAGGNASDLSGFDWPIHGPALWSPDGTSLLFMRVKILPSFAWVVQVAAGGGTQNIFGVAYGVPPSWSHDVSLVALAHGGNITLHDPVTGDTLRELPGTRPQFSPVNDDLAFRDEVTGHIHLIRPDSTADRDLHVEGFPRIWSPDGTRLAFAGIDGMYMINADGSDLSRIGPLNVEVSDVEWSADGRRIAYVTHTSSGPSTIYMAGADDSDRRPVVSAAALCCLSWRPPIAE